jgi:hypothetical protein
LDADAIALAVRSDPRVQEYVTTHPNFGGLLSRFTDAFGMHLNPLVMIVRDDTLSQLTSIEPIASFRDLITLSVVPYARACKTVYSSQIPRISYADSFWIYPWMLGSDHETLVASIPACDSVHMLEEFHGQSTPAFPVLEFNIYELYKPVYENLIGRWKRYYLEDHDLWEDRALFRSLNMAERASQMPAGRDTSLFDLGRSVALWVSAMEILAHPGNGRSSERKVRKLLEQVRNLCPGMSNPLHAGDNDTTLPGWVCKRLYEIRNDFLHGNPVGDNPFNPHGKEESLFWLAPCLYRLALTGFLMPSTNAEAEHYRDEQAIIELALDKLRPDHPTLTDNSPTS